MKQALMALAIAVGPLLSGFADEAPQSPPAPVIVAQFLAFSDTQAAQFQQLLRSFQATVGGLQQQIGPKQQALDTLLSTAQPDPTTAGKLLLEVHVLQQQPGQALQSYHESFLALNSLFSHDCILSRSATLLGPGWHERAFKQKTPLDG